MSWPNQRRNSSLGATALGQPSSARSARRIPRGHSRSTRNRRPGRSASWSWTRTTWIPLTARSMRLGRSGRPSMEEPPVRRRGTGANRTSPAGAGGGGEMDAVLAIVVIALLALLVLAGASIRVLDQFEQGVVLRFGKLHGETRGPGLTLLAPVADRLHKVNMQVVTMPVPAQEGITRDNVTVKVDAVVYYKVYDPVRVVVGVQSYQAAIAQVAQASLRSIIGKSELDDLLSNRERLNQGLELMLDNPAVDWGIHIDRVDIKDVALPESMKRSMSRQAEAERERRSRVITAEGELQASEKLAQAAAVMHQQPAALQLRLLQTMVEVAAEKNSTVVLPFPVELLRFLERATPGETPHQTPAETPPEIPAPLARGTSHNGGLTTA